MDLEEIFEDAFPESYDHNMQRNRPYAGQPHTCHGQRGKTEVQGITFRDLRDCFVRACFLSAGDQHPAGYDQASKGVNAALCENDVYDLDFNKMDPIAIAQNLCCEIERIMGIYPNIEPLQTDD
jgi:hypothetical protein